jgi:hypothetical protein
MKKLMFICFIFSLLFAGCATTTVSNESEQSKANNETTPAEESRTIEWLEENASEIFSGITFIGNPNIDRSKYTFYNYRIPGGAFAGRYTIRLQNDEVEREGRLAEGEIREFKLMFDSQLLPNNRNRVGFSIQFLDGWQSLSGESSQYLVVSSYADGIDRLQFPGLSGSRGDSTDDCIISTFTGGNITGEVTALIDSNIPLFERGSSLDRCVGTLNQSVQENGKDFRMFYTIKAKRLGGLIRQCTLDLLEWY